MICHKKEDKPTTYTKSEVDGLLTGKATITCVDNAIAHQSTRTTNTLNIKSDLVQFKGVNNIAYMNTLPTGISAYTNLYTDGTAQFKSGISVQEQKGINTWAVKCDISHNPAIFFQKVMDPLQEHYLQYVKLHQFLVIIHRLWVMFQHMETCNRTTEISLHRMEI